MSSTQSRTDEGLLVVWVVFSLILTGIFYGVAWGSYASAYEHSRWDRKCIGPVIQWWCWQELEVWYEAPFDFGSYLLLNLFAMLVLSAVLSGIFRSAYVFLLVWVFYSGFLAAAMAGAGPTAMTVYPLVMLGISASIGIGALVYMHYDSERMFKEKTMIQFTPSVTIEPVLKHDVPKLDAPIMKESSEKRIRFVTKGEVGKLEIENRLSIDNIPKEKFLRFAKERGLKIDMEEEER